MKGSIESQITKRFLQVMADNVGPAKRWRFKNAFAKSIDMFPQELHLLETGSIVKLRHIASLYKVMEISLEWLFTGKGEPYNSKTNATTDDRIDKILQEIGRLGTKMK